MVASLTTLSVSACASHCLIKYAYSCQMNALAALFSVVAPSSSVPNVQIYLFIITLFIISLFDISVDWATPMCAVVLGICLFYSGVPVTAPVN